MSIRRFDRGPCYMEECDDGRYVLHADHAAMLDYTLSEASKELAAVLERMYRAERYVDGQNLRSDYRTATEMRAALERAEKANAVLRAEARMWRDVDRLQAEENENGPEVVGMAEAKYELHRAMAATDAAGALKGVE